MNDLNIEPAVSKARYIKDSCCESYKLPRGRCFSCPEAPQNKDPDQERFD